MSNPATEIAQRLADNAEGVCRHFLSKGHREGRYWLVGDARNTPGQSLYVRLVASPDGRGAAGKWSDAATGEHGDLLDIIAIACGHARLRDTLDEARRFLSLPQPPPRDDDPGWRREPKAPAGSPEAAQRLLAACQPVRGTLVEAYLGGRSIASLKTGDPLRFHPRCYYRPSRKDSPGTRRAWPAMIAAVTDLDGAITGVHRTWLDPATVDKAPVAYPRRAMGLLLGNGVRFGAAGPVMVAGEGIETILSLRTIMPALPAIAGLSGAHLAAILFPPQLRRLYIARDDDPAGAAAEKTLTQRAVEAGIETVPLDPMLDDFNSDLRHLGADRLRAHVRSLLAAEDAEHFLLLPG
ncbi:MAG: toprim domain-containing protein [Burkholderiaceae bacterium]